MFDPRLSLMNDVSAQLKEHFGEQLYDTVIPRNIRLAEAPSFGMPALAYDKIPVARLLTWHWQARWFVVNAATPAP